MNFALLILYPLIASLLFRFRGGGLILLPGETVVPDHKRTQVRRVTCALGYGLMALNPFVGATLFLSMMTGWGPPVAMAIGAQTKREPEFAPFDWLALRLVGEGKPRAYGVAWLTLHGLFFGGLVALATGTVAYLILAGMGLCYYFTRDWEHGEWAFGALWGLAIALSFM